MAKDPDVQIALDAETEEMAKLRDAPIDDVRWRIKAGLSPKQAIEVSAAQKQNDDEPPQAKSGSDTVETPKAHVSNLMRQK